MSIHRKISGHPNICVFVSGAAHPIPERRGFAEFLMLLEFCPGLFRYLQVNICFYLYFGGKVDTYWVSIFSLYCCSGSLASIIRAAGTKLFSSSEVLRLFHGVTKAVQHLHSYSPPIIHRDIKVPSLYLYTCLLIQLCNYTFFKTVNLTKHQK